jgi:hypothetical protein
MTTTATPPKAPAPTGARGGLPWTVFRLHRWALWVWIAYVAVGAGLLLWAWGPVANDVRAVMDRCATVTTPGCDTALNPYNDFLTYGFFFILLAPFLVGAWAAAALTARETESGTIRLAWTQSVTPARWLTAKLVLPGAVVAAGTTLLLALYRLAYREGAGLREQQDVTVLWWDEGYFATLGVVVVPRVLCAVAVGVLLGLLLRRTLASLGTGLVLMLAGTATFVLERAALWPTEYRYGFSESHSFPNFGPEKDIWPLNQGAVTTSGEHAVGFGNDLSCFEAARHDRTRGFDDQAFQACLRDNGYTDVWSSYHPRSHFWPLQLVESGIWLAVAALAVCLSYRVLRRRTA